MLNVTIIRATTAGLLGLAAVVTGCQDKGHLDGDVRQTEPKSTMFRPEGETRSVQTVLARQAARGAAADATLYPAHFDGNALNSLGRRKLDAIVAGTTETQDVTVYLNLPAADGAAADARREVVAQYLAAAGLAEDRTSVELGENPATRHLASIDSDKLYKTERGTISAAASEDGGDAVGDAGEVLLLTPKTGGTK